MWVMWPIYRLHLQLDLLRSTSPAGLHLKQSYPAFYPAKHVTRT